MNLTDRFDVIVGTGDDRETNVQFTKMTVENPDGSCKGHIVIATGEFIPYAEKK